MSRNFYNQWSKWVQPSTAELQTYLPTAMLAAKLLLMFPLTAMLLTTTLKLPLSADVELSDELYWCENTMNQLLINVVCLSVV